jgi:hypothetical protein
VLVGSVPLLLKKYFPAVVRLFKFDSADIPKIVTTPPRSDAKDVEMHGNRAYLIGNLLKLYKKPPV